MDWHVLLGQNLAFQKLKKNSNLVNAKDIWGNCIIHALVDLQDYNLLKEFLESFNCNCNVQDEESGYTPLHRALFNGFLTGAVLLEQRGINLEIRDNEGMSAFDLLNSTLPVIQEKEESPNSSRIFDDESVNSMQEYVPNNLSWSVWSWGSNSNYLLGHSSEKKDPSLVFPPKNRILQRNIQLQDINEIYPDVLQVALSKYHACIVTTNGIYVCGFGNKGRLGLGNEESVLQPVLLEGLSDLANVETVGLGPDHTLAVTFDGELWSWGNNENGTLGNLKLS